MDVTYTDDGLVIFKCSEWQRDFNICKTGKCHGAKLNEEKNYNITCGHGYIRLSWTEYTKYRLEDINYGG